LAGVRAVHGPWPRNAVLGPTFMSGEASAQQLSSPFSQPRAVHGPSRSMRLEPTRCSRGPTNRRCGFCSLAPKEQTFAQPTGNALGNGCRTERPFGPTDQQFPRKRGERLARWAEDRSASEPLPRALPVSWTNGCPRWGESGCNLIVDPHRFHPELRSIRPLQIQLQQLLQNLFIAQIRLPTVGGG